MRNFSALLPMTLYITKPKGKNQLHGCKVKCFTDSLT